MSIQKKEYVSKKTGRVTTKYYAVVYDERTKSPIWSKGFDTRKNALIEEASMIKCLENPDINSMLFCDVVDSWIRSSEGVYSNSTMEGYLWYIKKHIYPSFKDLIIRKITTKQIQDFVNMMNEKYAAETVNKMINILSNIFNHARSLDILSEDIMSGIKRKKVVLKQVVTWSEKQIKEFLNYEKTIESDYYEMFLLVFFTGMRPSEVCGLGSNDLRGDVLILHQGYDRYNCLSNMKTSSSHRSIQLPAYIVDKIMNYITVRGANECGFLFVNKDGRPVNPNVFSKAFKRILRQLNKECDNQLPDISLYAASRHSFATNMIMANEVQPSIVSSIMGNSERVLQARYVHVKNEIKSYAVQSYVDKLI